MLVKIFFILQFLSFLVKQINKMPLLEIATNISKDKVTDEVLKEMSKELAATIGKPEQVKTYMMKFMIYITSKTIWFHEITDFLADQNNYQKKIC